MGWVGGSWTGSELLRSIRWESEVGGPDPAGAWLPARADPLVLGSGWARQGGCLLELPALSLQPSWGQEEQPATCCHGQESVQPEAEAGPPGKEQPRYEEDSQQGADAGYQAPAVLSASRPCLPPLQGRYAGKRGPLGLCWLCSPLGPMVPVHLVLPGRGPRAAWPGGQWAARAGVLCAALGAGERLPGGRMQPLQHIPPCPHGRIILAEVGRG